MTTRRLEGRVVIVTGSSTGIGASVATACAAEGAHVVVHGRDEARAERVVRSLQTEGTSFTGDLAQPDVCVALVEKAVTTYGRLDGVVNNAALTTRSDLASTTPELFDRLIAVNVRAPLLMIRSAMAHLRASGEGAVVNVGSLNAYCGEPDLLAYSVSKGALMTLTRNLANTHAADGVRINQLNVGWTLTDNEHAIFRDAGYPEDWHERVHERYAPSGALLSTEQVAKHVLHWLSADSKPVTGAVYEVEQYPIIGRPSSGPRLEG